MGDEPGPSKSNTRGKKNKKNVETMVEPEQPGTEDTAQSTPGDPPLPEENWSRKIAGGPIKMAYTSSLPQETFNWTRTWLGCEKNFADSGFLY